MFEWLYKSRSTLKSPKRIVKSRIGSIRKSPKRIVKSRIGSIRKYVSETGGIQFSDKKGNTAKAQLIEVVRNRSKRKWEYKIRHQDGEKETIAAPFTIYLNGRSMKPITQ